MKQSFEEFVKFKISQPSMLSESRTILNEFIVDQSAFVLLDEDFKTPFETVWETSIKNAEELPPDTMVVAEMKITSEDVEKEMSNCRDCFQSLKFFIEKAFPENPSVWQYFGYKDYEQARKNHDKMPRFMTDLNLAAVKYKTELNAVKCTTAMIANIISVRDLLNSALSEQHQQITERPLATKTRVQLLNEAWDIRLKVNKASKIVFKDDIVKMRIYLLPASEESGTVFNFTGTITETGTGTMLEKAGISLGNSIPVIYSDSNGKFGGAQIPDGIYTAHVVLDGFLSKDVPVTIVERAVFVAHIELEKYHAG